MRTAWIVARCVLAVAGCLAFLANAIGIIRAGGFPVRGLVIRRSERPGRFWFYVLGSLALSLSSGTAGAAILWAALTG